MNRKICAIVNGNFICYNKQINLAPDIPSPHAPVACLTFARGDEVKGGTAFMTELCCPSCCSALGSAGIKKIVYKESREDNQDEKTLDVARYFDIEVIQNGAIGL